MKRLGLLDLVDNLSKKTRCLLKKKNFATFPEKESRIARRYLCSERL